MRRVTLVLALLLAALSGCARPSSGAPHDDGVVRTHGCAGATSPPATSVDGTPQPADQEALDALASRIEPVAERDYGSVYAGLRLVQERDRLQVFRKPSAAFDRWLTGSFAEACVEVLDAPYSAGELHARQQAVSDDLDYWRGQGVQINTVSSDFVRGVVVVGTQDVDQARAALPAHYGAGVPITVESQGPVVG